MAFIEEYISQFTKAVGAIHAAIKDGVGAEDQVGTALFEIMQLRGLAASNLPYFGVITTSPSGFLVTEPTSDLPYFAPVSSGQISYKAQRINIAPQKISLARAFGSTYSNTHQYGVRIGLPINEVEKSTQIYSTTVSVTASSGSTSLRVANISLAQTLGFPLTAYVGNTYLVFSNVSSDGLSLEIDPSFNGGTLATIQYAGTRVHFIYEPRLLAVYGLPVGTTYQSLGNPATFNYYPPLPPNWLPIADLLVENPTNPVIATNGSDPAILRTALEWPDPDSGSPVFSAPDAKDILRYCDITRSLLRQSQANVFTGEIIRALEDYTRAVSTQVETSFRGYWANQPFAPTAYFARGVSFDNLERFEFSDQFNRAYYDATATDLQRTFAVFRGDRYTQTSPLIGIPPTSVTATAYLAGVVSSTINRGTYVYGVSGVTTAGETAPTYKQLSANSNNASNFLNELTWNAVSGAQFYHIYRRSTVAGDQAEYRLTANNEVTGSGAFSAPPTFSSAGDYTMSTSYVAFKFAATGGSQLGGVGLKIKTSAQLTNTTGYLSVALYEGTSTAPGGVLAATGTHIPYTSLTTGYVEYISQLNLPLINGTTYWVVVQQSTAPTGGNIILYKNSIGTNAVATSANGSTWSSVSSTTGYLKAYSYLDNGRVGLSTTRRGLLLTGTIGLQARQLSVFVPPVIPATQSELPVYGVTGSLTGTETTETKNELFVTIIARNGADGTPSSFTITVPQGTARATRFPVGNSSQVFDRVDDVQVRPGNDLQLGANNQIQWSVYDLITVETMP